MAVLAMLVVETDFGDDEIPAIDFTAIVFIYASWMAGTVIGAHSATEEFELDEHPDWSVVQEWTLLGARPPGAASFLVEHGG